MSVYRAQRFSWRGSPWAWWPRAAGTQCRLSAIYTDQTYFVHVNALGSVAMTSVSAGNVNGDTVFYPWGQDWVAGTPDGHYAAFEYAAAADLYVTPFRQYSNNQGRWLTPDPLGGDITNPQSLNRYAYVLNNPTTLTDPLGLDACQKAADPRVCRIENYYDLAGSPGLQLEFSDEFGGGSADLCSDPVYAESNAECGAAPPLGPSISFTPPYLMGGTAGGVWSEAAPPFGGGGGGLPCDFGTCGSGFGPAEGTAAITLWGVIFQTTGWASAAAAGLAGGVLLAGAAALPYDLYQGYHLAQAYGYGLPKGAASSRSPNVRQNQDFDRAIQQIEQRCGRDLSQGERRRVHDAIRKQGWDIPTIVEVGVGLFCPGR